MKSDPTTDATRVVAPDLFAGYLSENAIYLKRAIAEIENGADDGRLPKEKL